MRADNERPTAVFRELSHDECLAYLQKGGVGRVAVCTPEGPVILPVNFILADETVVFRTAPYTLLAGHAWDTAAFEVDELEPEMWRGWSVLVVGQAAPVDDADEIRGSVLRELTPWAPGPRQMFIQITPARITGRAVAS